MEESSIKQSKDQYCISVYLDEEKHKWGLSVTEQSKWEDMSEQTHRDFRTIFAKEVENGELSNQIEQIIVKYTKKPENDTHFIVFGPENNDVEKIYKDFKIDNFHKKYNEKSITDMISLIKQFKNEIRHVDQDIKEIIELSNTPKINDILYSKLQGIWIFFLQVRAIKLNRLHKK